MNFLSIISGIQRTRKNNLYDNGIKSYEAIELIGPDGTRKAYANELGALLDEGWEIMHPICINAEIERRWKHLRGNSGEEIEGRHEGETILVFGGGPSLAKTDISSFSKFTTIGANFINLLFIPTYQIATDSGALYTDDNPFQRSTAEKFWLDPSTFHYSCPDVWKEIRCRNTVLGEERNCFLGYKYPQGRRLPENWKGGVLSEDYNEGLRLGTSIMFPAINLAYLFGAKRIILFGVDLHDNKHFYPSQTDKQAKYENTIFPWLKTTLRGFERIAEFLKEKDVEVFNANPNSLLKAFPFIDGSEYGYDWVPKSENN